MRCGVDPGRPIMKPLLIFTWKDLKAASPGIEKVPSQLRVCQLIHLDPFEKRWAVLTALQSAMQAELIDSEPIFSTRLQPRM